MIERQSTPIPRGLPGAIQKRQESNARKGGRKGNGCRLFFLFLGEFYGM